MSENNEEVNGAAEQPDAQDVQTPAEETAPQPNPSEVAEAVKKTLQQQGVTQINLAACPCGTTGVNLILDMGQNSKVGRATCGACGIWGVDFLSPRTKDQEVIGRAAAKAWNEAPRAAASAA